MSASPEVTANPAAELLHDPNSLINVFEAIGGRLCAKWREDNPEPLADYDKASHHGDDSIIKLGRNTEARVYWIEKPKLIRTKMWLPSGGITLESQKLLRGSLYETHDTQYFFGRNLATESDQPSQVRISRDHSHFNHPHGRRFYGEKGPIMDDDKKLKALAKLLGRISAQVE